ncbi:MAG: LysM peptidoglycan-binding domain-containing protein, partial [Anaerolineae bacterium]
MKSKLGKTFILALLVMQLVLATGIVAQASPSLSPCSYYTVQRGDTLYSIARRHGTTVQAIAQASGILNPAYIYVGQVLCIPSGWAPPPPTGGYYTVQRGDNLYRIALRFGTSVWAIVMANNISNPSLIYRGQVLLIPGLGTAPPPPPPP